MIRVRQLHLRASARGRGQGTNLLRELMADAAASGRSVDLKVPEPSPAVRLYERLGFRLINREGQKLRLRWVPTRPARYQSLRPPRRTPRSVMSRPASCRRTSRPA
jgi:hypothetical protein